MALAKIKIAKKNGAWFTANPTLVLDMGQMVFLDSSSQVQFKVGDNSTQLSALPWNLYGVISDGAILLAGPDNSVGDSHLTQTSDNIKINQSKGFSNQAEDHRIDFGTNVAPHVRVSTDGGTGAEAQMLLKAAFAWLTYNGKGFFADASSTYIDHATRVEIDTPIVRFTQQISGVLCVDGAGDMAALDAALLNAAFGVEITANKSTSTSLGTSNVLFPTQNAVKVFVDNAIAALIASAPGVLDTLDEIAAAMGDDPNFAATMTTALAGKQPLATALTNIAVLVTAADKLIYTTALDTYAVTDFTAFARTLLDDIDAAAMRATLGLGDSATKNVGTSAGTVAAGNDSRLTDARNCKIYAYQNTDNSITGTLTETILGNLAIAAGDMGANDNLWFEAQMFCSGTSGTKTFKAYISPNNNSLTGAVLIGTLSMSAANISSGFQRRHVNKNSVSSNEAWPTANGVTTDFTSAGGAKSSTNVNYANAQWLIITCTLANTGDTGTLSNVQLYINKA